MGRGRLARSRAAGHIVSCMAHVEAPSSLLNGELVATWVRWPWPTFIVGRQGGGSGRGTGFITVRLRWRGASTQLGRGGPCGQSQEQESHASSSQSQESCASTQIQGGISASSSHSLEHHASSQGNVDASSQGNVDASSSQKSQGNVDASSQGNVDASSQKSQGRDSSKRRQRHDAAAKSQGRRRGKHDAAAKSQGNVHASSQSQGNVEASSQSKGNGASSPSQGNVDASSQSKGNVDASSQSKGNVDASSQSKGNVNTSSQSKGNDASSQSQGQDASSRSQGNVDASSRSQGNVDASSQSKGNVDASSQSKGNVDTSSQSKGNDASSQSQGQDASSQSKGNVDASSQSKGNVDASSQSQGNVDASSQGQGNVDASFDFHASLKGCFSKVYAFGGSDTDTGNAQALGGQLNASASAQSKGRLGDGRLVVDFLCDALSVPQISAYKEVNVNSSQGSVNFAVAGSTALPSDIFSTYNLSSLIWKDSPKSFQTQIEWFNKFLIDTGCKGPPRSSCKADIENSLFWVGEIGLSDFMSTVSSTIPLPHVTEISVRIVCELLKTMLDNGAKYVVVQGLPPVGCLPAYMSSSSPKDRDHMGCAASTNVGIMSYNQILQERLQKFRKLYPHCSIVYADYWNAYVTILTNPNKYQIEEPFKACCEHKSRGGIFTINRHSLFASQRSTTCKDPNKYISWDGIHLTQAMNQKLTAMFINEGFCKPSFTDLVKAKLKL
ncbi:hypothetical protein ACS0TY_010845 [Phlomoides rotata]